MKSKRVETELEESLYIKFERACQYEDISMRKKIKHLITSFVERGKKSKSN